MATKFIEIINNKKFTLVDFYADWCGPCKLMKPILEELKSKLRDEITILKIDVDKNPQVSQAYQIQGVPTLILFGEGKVKWRKSGVVSTQELQNVILKHS